MARRMIAVSGIVQGVGFRPFVHALACRLGLRGFVRNQTGGVLIEVEGDLASLDRFLTELTAKPPPLAHIDRVAWLPCGPRGDDGFQIEPSAAEPTGVIFISPDVATCAACLAELFDPADRRYRYPFLNCTNCGPRLTIIRATPYDRERTTMAGFALCPACRAEYDNPADRRFHAQPIACPACGPRLAVCDARGQPLAVADPLAQAVAALREGQIVAVKGLGGYHLACDARREAAVRELRRRKHRDEKPFAVMVADLAAARQWCDISPPEEDLLLSPRRPIVLLRRRPGTDLAESVAPGNPYLGIMLPYTPLHHLLLHDLGGVPLVMTSGNRSDEPIAYEDADALDRLAGIADLFLTHDRPIHLRCDDSVTRIVAGAELPLRRSRGHAPQPLPLPIACPVPTLALGGQLKATFALGLGRHAFLSHHLGDLDHYAAYRAYVEGIDHYQQLFAVRPALFVHDLHPDYASTRHAITLASREGPERRSLTLPARLLAVQHHHAHMASCMAEHGLDEPVIGVAFDGTGYGTDGAVWGGEFLIGDYRHYRRAAHFRYVAMPGGEQAIREPWRMAAAYLLDAGLPPFVPRGGRGVGGEGDVSVQARSIIPKMIERRLNTPLTSSAGRLFDGVAALAGVRQRVSYEGQAAMELEWLAAQADPDGAYPFDLLQEENGPFQIDPRPLIAAAAADVRRGVSAALIARRFHSTLVEIIARVCERLREATGLGAVVLSGGVFMNALLLGETVARLTEGGFRVYRHRRVPPNDGGLCLGQLAIAVASGRREPAGGERPM
ncbi:MAG TPA: carbamoyltransferase HypF [Gemmataceae bacterium]|nr:carbamoyltransferase HypF [Gemmataceae bacterium]